MARTQAEAQAELAEIRAYSGSLGQMTEAHPDYVGVFGTTTLAELESPFSSNPAKYAMALRILPETRKKLQETIDKATANGTVVLVNGVPAASGDAALASVQKLSDLHGITVGADPAYVTKLQIMAGEIADPNARVAPPVNAITPPLTTSPRINSAVATIASATATEPKLDETEPVNGAPLAAPRIPAGLPPVQRNPDPRTTLPNATLPIQRVAATAPPRPATAAPTSSPISLGRITPQTTVLDLIVNGVVSSSDPEAAGLRDAAKAQLTDELTKSKPELASNPQAMAAAVQQGLPNSVRGLILELSKTKSIQQKIAGGFLDAMKRESPGAEQSGLYQNLKRLSSDERTFPQFLNTNMLDGITKDYEQRVRAENGGKVPATIMDAVANNIMRVKPEIKKYNDAVGQDICDFVRNPEISRERLLNSPSTQAQIRSGLAQYKKDHPFQTFFAGLIGINMEQRAQQEAAARIAKEVKNKNYSSDIQSGFINEFNKRAEKEMRGEQLENVHAFTRHLSHLPYSRFIQEDISPRRMSAIILGIERPGEDRGPTRHLIPQQLISRAPQTRVNVAAAQTMPDQQQRPQAVRPFSMHGA